ncbi:hypothetical protein V8G54_020681 [Vigna mungo]|uniref:2-isopropylmalate synthase n=1 Tax=Vigna mungo TaxID=3915 RepID=A0AAQ3NC24_VIGMU
MNNGTRSRSRPEYIPGHIPDPCYIRILDTTLRDGEQAPGAAMTAEQKLRIARQLAKLGVDVIEAGFPSASQEDFNAVKMIAEEVGKKCNDDEYVPVIVVICRCNEKDIRTAWEAVKEAKRPRLMPFIATSPIHMESDREFLYEIFGDVIKAGATTLGVGDTVGITMPLEFGKLIADIKANTPGIENAIISAHCHNDLGHATANTIEAARAGARQLEVTINGIGERAGNAAFEEVEEFSGMHLQPHKAIVGDNAFLHESGIHQDGLLKHRGTYEILSPEDIGYERSSGANMVLGKLREDEIESVFRNFKAMAEKTKRVTDVDLKALVSDKVSDVEPIWKLGGLQVTCGTLNFSTSVKLVSIDSSTHVACSVGKGPVDSAYKAVDLIVKEGVKVVEYSLNTVTEGTDAIATVHVVVRKENMNSHKSTLTENIIYPTFSGIGKGVDVVVSSVEAYLTALNKMLHFKE